MARGNPAAVSSRGVDPPPVTWKLPARARLRGLSMMVIERDESRDALEITTEETHRDEEQLTSHQHDSAQMRNVTKSFITCRVLRY